MCVSDTRLGVSDTSGRVLDTPGRVLDTPGSVLDTPRRVSEAPSRLSDTLKQRLDTSGCPRGHYLVGGARVKPLQTLPPPFPRLGCAILGFRCRVWGLGSGGSGVEFEARALGVKGLEVHG